ncbi:MAG: rhamnulokinase [Planctomycetes bacterium]|nr:rhamnulokinase [Planctomycetota bacterium]
MADNVYLAIDLGASSGRHVAGLFDGSRLNLAEVYRFDNGPVYVNDHMYWDVLGLWQHIQKGLRAAGTTYGGRLKSLGVDTWGVDFGLLGRGDELMGNPYNYRDPRTVGMMDKAFHLVPREEIFAQTGLQFMELNSLFQLLAMKLGNSPLLDAAESLLFMPDLFHWMLTGQKGNEFTISSTSQCYNPATREWAADMLQQLGIPSSLFGDVLPPGTKLGPLRKSVSSETGVTGVEVVLPGTHDTASAVMAVPTASAPSDRPNWCYISSGTWSLVGVEVPQPVITERCRALNFTNEGGVGGTIRLLKNICGLWLLQECRRIWKHQGAEHSWEELTKMAAEAEPLRSFIFPDDASFTAPPNMPQAIQEFCNRTGQPVPESKGAVVRCVLESLAMRYRQVVGMLEELTQGRIETVHIVGGGTQNRQLCQMAADACKRLVVAGPVEATAIGNLMMQAVAAGQVADIRQARKVIRRSFDVVEYTPQQSERWDEAYGRYTTISR